MEHDLMKGILTCCTRLEMAFSFGLGAGSVDTGSVRESCICFFAFSTIQSGILKPLRQLVSAAPLQYQTSDYRNVLKIHSFLWL